MRKQLVCGVVLILTVAALAAIWAQKRSAAEAAEEARNRIAAEEKGSMLAHNVYFALKDNSAESRQKLVDACKKYLSNHPGEVFFAAGTLAEDLKREVNDRDFDVALHIVFKDQAAHDKYQDDRKHKQFIEENKDNWKKVRVFDSVVSK